MRKLLLALAGAGLLAGAGHSHAGVIVSTLGNATPGFSDGDLVGAVDVANAQVGPAPFDAGNAGNGNEVLGPNFDQSWTHAYGPIVGTITGATIEFGIHDSEGGSVGAATDGSGDVVTLADEQLDTFTVEGADYKAELIAAEFEDGGQGLNGQYEVYSLALGAAEFGDLADGSADFSLALEGPVFSPRGLPFLPDIVNDFNGASLVYATLTIQFDDPTQPPDPLPEPTSVALLGLGVLALAGRGVRRRPGGVGRPV